MRAALVFLAFIGCSAAAAEATDAPALPDGWSRAADGTVTHDPSGTKCPPTIGSYAFVQLDGPSEPGILGICQYSGGDLRIGKIRVRKFIDGVGETPLAIQNDRVLMGLIPAQGVPPGSKLVEAFRGGPGPVIDGAQTAQFVLTSRAGDVMVDCISQTSQDKAERDLGFNDFLKSCLPEK